MVLEVGRDILFPKYLIAKIVLTVKSITFVQLHIQLISNGKIFCHWSLEPKITYLW